MSDRLMRGALIGTGSIAPYHLTAWQRAPGVEIVALCNRTVEKAQALAQRYQIAADHIYADLDTLLAHEPNLDFVDIATAPHLHRAQTEAAAARGLHVLCQKPLAPSLEDAQAMLAACQAAGVLLSVNENWRWRAWYREVHRRLQAGALGRLRYVRLTAHHDNVLPRPDGSLPPLLVKQAYTRDMPRLILFEWGIHLIDTLRLLLGEPSWVHAHLAHVSPLAAGEDRALIMLGFGEVVACLDLSWASHVPDALPSLLEEALFEGDGGTLALVPNRGEGDCLRLVTPLPPERVPVNRDRAWSPVLTQVWPAHDGDIAAAYQASYDAAQAHFIECLRAGRLPETHAADNLRTLQAMFGAYQSAAENRVVAL
ncbi:MAG: Gfo/Idh/MocA family oxidoreductase [Anaerolineales bacterium]